MLIDWYLPGTKAGGPVRSIYSLVNLLKDEFEFYILTSNKDLGSDKDYENIKANSIISLDGINYCYFNSGGLSEKNILKTIEEINPSLVYINSFWSYPFSISIVRAKKKGALKPQLLLAPRGMLSPGALGLKSMKKKGFLLLTKIFGWHKRIKFHATNVQEQNEIIARFPNAKIRIAPNLNAIKATDTYREKKTGALKLFYLSRIAKVKNLHFALDALHEIPSNVTITYDIFGNIEDAAYWEQCQKLISLLPENIRVNYVGELAFNEIQPVISSYHALLLPTLNENFGHSIVESLASGCIAVISDQTPWNDLSSFNAGYALSLADKTAFVNALTELAALDQKQFDEKSKNAITYISSKLNLEESKQQYISLFNESIKN